MIQTHNNTIITEQVVPQYKIENIKGIEFQTEQIPIYKVISVDNSKKSIALQPNDYVICSSAGNRFDYNGKILYMFNKEHVIGKIEYDE